MSLLRLTIKTIEALAKAVENASMLRRVPVLSSVSSRAAGWRGEVGVVWMMESTLRIVLVD